MSDLLIVHHDAELEKQVLGAIIGEHKQSFEAIDGLTEQDFFHVQYRQIFKIVRVLAEKGESIGLVSVYDEAQRIEDLQGGDLFQYLGGLGNDVHRATDILYAVKKLRELSVARNATVLFESLQTLLQRGNGEPQQIIQSAIEKLSELARSGDELADQGVTYFEAARQALESIGQEKSIKIYSDVDGLDRIIGGFRPGELVIVTAETGSGKTLFAQQTRARACRDGYVSLFCSGEMWARELMKRELTALANVSPDKMRIDERLTRQDMQDLIEAASHQCNKCRILDGELEIRQIRRVARARKARTGLDFLILDYDELIEAPGQDENEQLRNVVRTAKSIAMELNCAVMLISQLRKESGQNESDKPDTRPPSLSSLYSTGAKIKHSHIVLHIRQKWVENLVGDEKDAVIWITKNRTGPKGYLPARFNIRTLRFNSVPENSTRESFHS